MSGFGLFPIGVGPFGLWTPDEAPPPPTGNVGSRWIDPATRDYSINESTKNLKQMPAVRQQVLLALMTIKKSAATVPRFGASFPSKMNETFEIESKNSCRIALAHLTESDPPTIRIEKIDIVKGRNSRAEGTLTYTDISTGERDTVNLP